MYRILFLWLALLLPALSACSPSASGPWSPVFPPDDYDYYPPYNYDDRPVLTRDMEGEWEGFLYERYRSDYLPLRKHMVALKCSYNASGSWPGEREWVKVRVLVDGRPAAAEEVCVFSKGYLSFVDFEKDIRLTLSGWFFKSSASGTMEIAWEEKVSPPGTDKVDMHFVTFGGDFDLSRVSGSHWASAWQLFETYGEAAFELSDEMWLSATAEGLEHLQASQETALRGVLQESSPG